MTVAVWIGVMLLGGLGAVARFSLDRAVSKRVARPFPFGTLVVNLSGALLLGFLAGLALSPHLALLAGTGFVGSYTTFSTWMLETQRLAEERQVVVGVRQHRGQRRARAGGSVAGSDDRSRAVTDYVKLTAYFDERLRHGDRFTLRRPARPLRRERGRHQRRAAGHRELRPAPRVAHRPVVDHVGELADRGRRGGRSRQDGRAGRPGVSDGGPRPRHAGTRAARRNGCAARCGEAHDLRRPTGSRGRQARVPRGVRCVAPTRIRGRLSVSRRRRHRARRAEESHASSAATSAFR